MWMSGNYYWPQAIDEYVAWFKLVLQRTLNAIRLEAIATRSKDANIGLLALLLGTRSY